MRADLPRITSYWVIGLLAALVLGRQSARADDWSDCAAAGASDKIVAACTSVIDKAERSKADLARAYGRRGFLLDRLGQKDRALADFTRAVELDPTNPTGYMGRGFHYAQQQQWA